MSIEQALCEVFCDGLTVERVPAGLSVATAFEGLDGDRIGFYLTRIASSSLWRLEDDGSLVPTLIASGVNVREGTRARLFESILEQARAHYDPDNGELHSEAVAESELPNAALRFVTMLIRVAALAAMRPELVSGTFRDDAVARIKAELSPRFAIEERSPISAELADFEPDLVLRADGLMPVAVFVAVSDSRVYEAIFLRMAADHEAHQPCAVVALFDKDDTRLVTKKMRQRARNRLDASPVYYGEQSMAIAHIARQAISMPGRLH